MDELNKGRYEQAFAAARRLFGNDEDAAAWLGEPSAALGNVTPTSLLATDEGLQLVIYEINQMEYGHPV